MTKILISILWFLVFTKLLIFWVWLWQLKEYHLGRFKAHFETQKIRKFVFSFHGIRCPELTQKVAVILTVGIFVEFFFLLFISNFTNYLFYTILLVSIILAPITISILILLFQIPANILIKRILEEAKKKREQFKDLTVIGITGSYGKTAVKEFLYEILSQKFNVLKTKKNINAEIGIGNTILSELNQKHQVFIAEIGAYERGKIKQVCEIIKPKIGILTGINEQHLSTFGSLENIKKAKNEILECSEIKIDYNNLDLTATDIVIGKKFVSFKADGVDFKVNLLGKHNINNILLAASCAKKLGMSLEEISKACLKIKPEQGGMKFLKRNGLTVLDSSYSANPDGVIADLDYLQIYSGSKIIIMPCLIELGKESKRIHKRIGQKIAEVCDFAIITTKDYFKEIKGENKNILLIENPEDIIAKVRELSNQETVILLEGRVPHLIWD
jgi:UDP-N-acetylmuramoyl-tripeptide--D-alanyl-D-alanine ligase